LWNTNKGAKFWRQINVLALLFDFKQWLIEVHNLNIVLLLEVQNHRNGLSDLTLFELARLGSHVVLDCTDLVGFVLTISSHDDGSFEFFVNSLGNFLICGWFSHKSLTFFFEALSLFLDELQTVINGKILGDVVYN
jgi:hypothetical protein